MLNLFILTSQTKGTAGHHLPVLLNTKKYKVQFVIYNEMQSVSKKKRLKQIIKKVKKIGIFGALNGIRMRKWFSSDVEDLLNIETVESICKQHNIPFYKISGFSDKQIPFIFSEFISDLGISLGNGYIPKSFFTLPKFGMINIHHEILPHYQNAQSIIWQIYNGSSNTGYTIHEIDSSIDTGNILYQKPVSIAFKNSLATTISATSALLLKESAAGLKELLENFSFYTARSKKQEKGTSYTTPSVKQYYRIYKNFCKLKNSKYETTIK